MGRRGVFVPIEKSLLVELYWDQGLSLPQIAERLDVTTMTVHRRMVTYGIPRRKPGGPVSHDKHLPPPAQVLTRRFLMNTYQRQGMTAIQIAAQTGYSAHMVRLFLRRFRIPIQPGAPPPTHNIDRKELAKLRRQGLTVSQIAGRFGCSKRTVERALERYGLTRG
jgi:transposase